MSNRAKEDSSSSRSGRETETREANARKATWKPPSVLPDPTPEPGYHYRWIRARTMGESDNRNVSSRFREGYVPVRAEDHKDLQILTDKGSEFADKYGPHLRIFAAELAQALANEPDDASAASPECNWTIPLEPVAPASPDAILMLPPPPTAPAPLASVSLPPVDNLGGLK